MKYCGVATPFKDIRVYQHCAMGMPESEICLEELMSWVLSDLLLEGRLTKCVTAEEDLANWALVLATLHCNNLRFSAKKTVICPKLTIILRGIWSAGTPCASPHRLCALATVEPPSNVHGLRSFIGAYEVLSHVLPAMWVISICWSRLHLGISERTILCGTMI